MAFVSILSQIKLLFVLLVIQLVWYILKQFFTSVSELHGRTIVYNLTVIDRECFETVAALWS